MDLGKIIRELREERDRVNEVIRSIERLAAKQSGKRRGRPPNWLRDSRKKEREEGEAEK